MSNKVRRIFSKAVNLITSATAQGLSKGELGSPDTPEEMKSIARIAAEEGIVMLKNNGVLPIEKMRTSASSAEFRGTISSSATVPEAMSTSPIASILWTA